MFKDKKAVFFDMDGTLIDSVGVWNDVDRTLIKRLGGNPETEDVQAQRDLKLREFAGAESPYTEYCGYLGEKYGSPLSGEEIMKTRYEIAQDFLRTVVDYKPDADKFIHMLKEKGYIVAVVSTTRRKNMDVYKEHNVNMKTKAPVDEVFDRIYTREDASVMKPDPEIYLKALADFGFSAEECLVFEDSLIGIEASTAAGIDTVSIYDKYSDEDMDRIKEMSMAHFNTYKDVIAAFEAE